ncbi:hypothetical protein Cylst_1476 [Cylindrospermum stagnale PCC 7417]|uniref:Uncharacterized protein n=1 Tax=Cylindrospermum stagnale PCC 7417 TaxID=56107 RepID=K9WTP3_9NOST|nr:hypothetical protein [Cylindrospermum stagnale]AFZ23760.1 hypothetical protein Cylst_1476 [Cylindrospermum stagnale PCC 7417]
MNHKITAALSIMAALTALESSVFAQSPEPQPNLENFTLSGDSLIGIDDRSAQRDFGKFFEQQNRGSDNTTSEQLPLNESISLPSTPIFLQPAQSTNGNDGLQLQLDLGNE